MLFEELEESPGAGISISDFLAACMKRSTYLLQRNLRTVFNHIDKDQSGNVERWELAEIFGELYVDGFLKEADLNGDGMISYNEFCDVMSSQDSVALAAASEPADPAAWDTLKGRRRRRRGR